MLATALRKMIGRPQSLFDLADKEWLRVLERSVDDRNVDGFTLPGFPDPALQSATVGSSGVTALQEAFRFYQHVKERCRRAGRPLTQGQRLLDFGIGWGRMARFYIKDGLALHGADVNPELLTACAKTGLDAELRLIDPRGALPWRDHSMEVVIAYSVFTHLPEEVADHWLAEIARVLVPGGMFVATVEPPRFLTHFRDMQDATHPWHQMLSTVVKSMPSLFDDLAQTGFAYIPSPGEESPYSYGDSVMTPQYALERWGRHFKGIEFLDDPARFWQAVVTCQRD